MLRRDGKPKVKKYATEEERREALKASNRAYAARNKEKRRAYARANPHIIRKTKLKARYGITPEQFDAILASQDHKCAICKSSDPGWGKQWHTDHDHETGTVRGVLYWGCNNALGLMQDDVVRLRAAANYLEHNGKELSRILQQAPA